MRLLITFSILITSQDPTWMTFYPLEISQERPHFLSRKLRGHTPTTSHYSSTDESHTHTAELELSSPLYALRWSGRNMERKQCAP